MAIEHTLTKLQRVVRLGQKPDGVSRRNRRIFDDMTQDMLGLTEAEDELMQGAIAELEEDLRFEHLDHRAADREVWWFLCDAFIDRNQDHVPLFVEAHAREPLETTCYFPLEHLIIKERVDMGEVTLLPVGDPEVPSGRFEEFPPPCAGIVAVPVIGTSGKRMKDRAEHLARHALRRLRVGMRQDNQIHDRQLRFRLGAFTSSRTAAKARDSQRITPLKQHSTVRCEIWSKANRCSRSRRVQPTARRRKHSWHWTGSIARGGRPTSSPGPCSISSLSKLCSGIAQKERRGSASRSGEPCSRLP